MEEKLKELYIREIDRAALDFDHDPEIQGYLTQSRPLWQGEDMPEPLFRLLDSCNYMSFAHGFRLGMRLGMWGNGTPADIP